jgi:hypothetical protein
MKDNETLVKLAVNVEPFQLALFKDHLEENGIQCFVTGGIGGSGSGSSGAFYGMPARNGGAYTIKVRKSDEKKALEVLDGIGYNAFSEDGAERSFLEWLASPTLKIPFIAKYSLNVRLSILAFALTAVITLVMLCFYTR